MKLRAFKSYGAYRLGIVLQLFQQFIDFTSLEKDITFFLDAEICKDSFINFYGREFFTHLIGFYLVKD